MEKSGFTQHYFPDSDGSNNKARKNGAGFTQAPFSSSNNGGSDNKQNGAGFTLVEILVAAFIFSLVIALISGVFVSVLRSQNRILATQVILDNASYSMEYMSRALRMARTDEPGAPNCAAANRTYKITGGGDSIDFLNYEENCQEFSLSGTTLKEVKDGDSRDVTPDEVRVTNLNFHVIGESVSDSLQPSVTIFMTFQGAVEGASDQPEVKVQTTVTKRNLDIERH